MDRNRIIETLRRHNKDFDRHGVAHAALFGSFVRGDQSSESDIDILIDLDQAAELSVFDYVDLKDYIASLFSEPVDVVSRQGLKPHVRTPALADAVDAF